LLCRNSLHCVPSSRSPERQYPLCHLVVARPRHPSALG
jgi:hypothetical protein